MDVAWYEELRESYRPSVVRLLLVGESPPDPGGGAQRFFYAPTLSHDNLYRGVSSALYGGIETIDLADKVSVLNRLRDDGVWLIDAVEEPIDKRTMAARRQAISEGLPALVGRVRDLAPTVGVLVCHGVVFDKVAPALSAVGITVLHQAALPFPLGNWRARFVSGARSALETAGWWDRPTTGQSSAGWPVADRSSVWPIPAAADAGSPLLDRVNPPPRRRTRTGPPAAGGLVPR